ncbi:MAG: hypothetical protein WBA88_00760 [Pseudaminobacter sp.]
MAGLRGLGALLTASIGLAVSVPAAHAASDLCRQLEAQRTSGPGTGSSAHLNQYDIAIAQQRQQLLLARDRTAEAGCGFSMVGAGIRYCAKLNARIERMERNLDKLERQRDRSVARSGVSADDRLLALLAANGCDTGDTDSSANAELIEDIFGPSAGNDTVAIQEGGRHAMTSGDTQADTGTGSFEIIAGRPPADEDVVSPRPSPSIVTPDVAAPPLPVEQPQSADLPGKNAIAHQPDPDRKVRVVGPAFLPDPGAAIDLQAPAPRQGR